MAIQMIKIDGQFVPAEKKDGKWVPIEGARLEYTADGIKVTGQKENKEE